MCHPLLFDIFVKKKLFEVFKKSFEVNFVSKISLDDDDDGVNVDDDLSIF